MTGFRVSDLSGFRTDRMRMYFYGKGLESIDNSFDSQHNLPKP